MNDYKPNMKMNHSNLRVMGLGEVPRFFAGRLDAPIRIQASSEAIEVFRGIYGANDNPWVKAAFLPLPSVVFELEPHPYRSNGVEFVVPYEKFYDIYAGENILTPNPKWLEAPFELVVGYGGGGMQAVLYKRTQTDTPLPSIPSP